MDTSWNRFVDSNTLVLGTGFSVEDYLRWVKIDANYIGVGGKEMSATAQLELPSSFKFLADPWPKNAESILLALKNKKKKFGAIYFDRGGVRDPWLLLDVICTGLKPLLSPGGVIYLPYFSLWPASEPDETPEHRRERFLVFDKAYQTNMKSVWETNFSKTVDMSIRELEPTERHVYGFYSPETKMWEIRP